MTAPEPRVQVTEYAGRYFDEVKEPIHRAAGVPHSGIGWMRQRYIADVLASSEAQRGLAEHYGVEFDGVRRG